MASTGEVKEKAAQGTVDMRYYKADVRAAIAKRGAFTDTFSMGGLRWTVKAELAGS